MVRRAVDRKREFLPQSLRPPSLRAQKYAEASDLWQARVSQGGEA